MAPTIAAATGPLPPAETRLARSVWFQGGLITVHLDARDTHGAFGLIEARLKPGAEPPLHIQGREDETFYVLEGTLKVTRGNEQLILNPGECGFLPRGVPHTFQILSSHARFLNYITPGGFEDFFRQLGRPAEALDYDPQPAPPDIPRLLAVTEQFGAKFVR